LPLAIVLPLGHSILILKQTSENPLPEEKVGKCIEKGHGTPNFVGFGKFNAPTG